MMTKFGLRTVGLSKGEIPLFPLKLPPAAVLSAAVECRLNGPIVDGFDGCSSQHQRLND
jgi:hypothetical protein